MSKIAAPLGSYYLLPGGGASVCVFVGGPECFGVVKGGTSFFSVGRRGDQNFLRVEEGGTKIFS